MPSRTGTTTATISIRQYASMERLASIGRSRSFRCSGRTPRCSSRRSYASAADAGRGAEVQGPAAGLPGCERGDGALRQSWRSTSTDIDETLKLHPRRRRHRSAAALPGAATRAARAVTATTTMRRSVSTSSTAGTSCIASSRCWYEVYVGRGGELSDAQPGARALLQNTPAMPIRTPSIRLTRTQGDRRRRRPRAGEVLGDLAQRRTPCCVGRTAARTSSTRPTRISSCTGSSRVRARLTARFSAARWCRFPTSCSTRTSSRRSTC